MLAQATIKGNKTDLSVKPEKSLTLSQEHGLYNIRLEEEDDYLIDKGVIESQYYHSRLYSATDTSSFHAVPTSSSVHQPHPKPTASLIYDQDTTPNQTSSIYYNSSHSSLAEKQENATPITVTSETRQASSNPAPTAKETLSTSVAQPKQRLDSTSTAAKELQKPSNVKHSANSVISSINVDSSSTLLHPSMLAMLPLLALL
ncbi:hypothetical protein DSO57_1034644 [Entomophthora muscae]|uniref:Uncharacterized protein n=1 Tax=Entomophthora muscae TaxID=34485 RepID=A0ACC2TM85_9FUNG|nr:hypothetical protein DSO57_1034644 [Entomophthora muscae]